MLNDTELHSVLQEHLHWNRARITFIVAFVLLTWTGTMLRGPNWDFFWPWEPWPAHAIPF